MFNLCDIGPNQGRSRPVAAPDRPSAPSNEVRQDVMYCAPLSRGFPSQVCMSVAACMEVNKEMCALVCLSVMEVVQTKEAGRAYECQQAMLEPLPACKDAEGHAF
eukprot:1157945-Pelagomonas_calceolata.AAC.2